MRPSRAGLWQAPALAVLWSIAGLLIPQKWVVQRPAAVAAQTIMHIVASTRNL